MPCAGRLRLATVLAPLALMAVIFRLSAEPNLGSGLEWDFVIRKVAHMVEFGALAALWNWAIMSWMRTLGARRAAKDAPTPDRERAGRSLLGGIGGRVASSFARWSIASLVSAALISMAYAASDEIHQATVVTRHASPVDVAIDWIGIGLACAAIARFGRRVRAGPQP